MADKTYDTRAESPLLRGSNTASGVPAIGMITSTTPTYFPPSGMHGRQAVRQSIAAKDVTAAIVADLIVSFCREHGDVVTNLKLQRLLYFAQGWYLGIHGKKLFKEPLEAWASGPVQPDVYAKFAPFGASPISHPFVKWKVADEIQSHVTELMGVYGGFSSFDLQRIACDEQPWRDSRIGLAHDEPSNRVIDTTTMKKVYRERAKQSKQ